MRQASLEPLFEQGLAFADVNRNPAQHALESIERVADEAIKTADLRGLVRWLNDQPSWSDFPIVLLTHQGGGPERNPDAVRL